MTATPPVQKPGNSRQDYGTPKELLDAVRQRLGITEFTIDLAAHTENAVCKWFYSLEDNAFDHEWDHTGWAWLNPPFNPMGPWVHKASRSLGRIAMLVPAAVGSNWWRDHVDGKAQVLFLNGRVTFVGEDAGYPKDTAILLYNSILHPVGYEVWSWT